jgi:hypothetical protein
VSTDNIILKFFVEVQNDQFDCFISYFKIIGLLFKKKKKNDKIETNFATPIAIR